MGKSNKSKSKGSSSVIVQGPSINSEQFKRLHFLNQAAQLYALPLSHPFVSNQRDSIPEQNQSIRYRRGKKSTAFQPLARRLIFELRNSASKATIRL
jgi:hypothetical protein